MSKAKKLARGMGFGNPKFIKLSGKKRRKSVKRFNGGVFNVSGKRRKIHLKKMKALYGKKKRRYGARSLRGLMDDKKSLGIGLVAGGGVAFALKKLWENADSIKAKLPSSLVGNENEVLACGSLLLGVALVFSDKIPAVKRNAKLAQILKASGIGLSVGTLALFAKEKFMPANAIPALTTSGRGLRGVASILDNHRRLSGTIGRNNIKSLQSNSLGVPALGLAGNVVSIPKGLNGGVHRLQGNVVRLNGATNFNVSTQTGLTDAEYGL